MGFRREFSDYTIEIHEGPITIHEDPWLLRGLKEDNTPQGA
jgi:hypothetical protein